METETSSPNALMANNNFFSFHELNRLHSFLRGSEIMTPVLHDTYTLDRGGGSSVATSTSSPLENRKQRLFWLNLNIEEGILGQSPFKLVTMKRERPGQSPFTHHDHETLKQHGSYTQHSG